MAALCEQDRAREELFAHLASESHVECAERQRLKIGWIRDHGIQDEGHIAESCPELVPPAAHLAISIRVGVV